jgi:hypothetical protein
MKAGKKIWISKARIASDKWLVEDCLQGKDLPGSGENREDCLKALVSFMATQDSSIFGLDFPFSLPAEIIGNSTWKEFILSFPDEYASPDKFRQVCRSRAGEKELRRRTDQERKTPFSPFCLAVILVSFNNSLIHS